MSKSEITVLDGAMGTMLMVHGVPVSSSFEKLNLTRPSLITEIHRSYLDAGAKAIVANTFGANRPRLARHGLTPKLEAINRAGVRIAKKAAMRKRVFASIGPLGSAAKKMAFSEMLKHFKEQVRALERESPFGYVIETMTSLTEAEAATLAARELSDGKILTFMTRLPRSRALTEDGARLIAETLRAAGADVIGANCGISPEDSLALIKSLAKVDGGPFAARPAAGIPGRVLSAEDFAGYASQLKKLGCTWIGGCCGTTPAHIRALTLQFP
jgi:5-methyltetrahydrofolate--homocysteine methyltransferase